MKDPRDIILAPVVSEKSYGLIEQGVYTFKWNTPGPTANTRLVELSVGDATLEFKPQEVADLVAELVS